VIANTLHLAAERRNGSTVLSKLQTNGLWRSSRPFREGIATRIVVSQLGPGMIRGDEFRSGGEVGPDAHLIVTGQMATRILPGSAPVTTHATWSVAAGGMLELLNEPTIVTAGAALDAHLSLHLEGNARAVISDIVARSATATVRTTMKVERGCRIALIDVLQLDDDLEGGDIVIGTLIVLGGRLDLAALDRIADGCESVRIGVGTFESGDTLARVVASHITPVREALTRLHARVYLDQAAASRVSG
jgi:urease accessory protein UreH